MPEPIVVLLKAVFIWLIRWIPGWILRRKLNAKALVERFGVELMSPTSLDIRLDPEDPTVRLYLRLLNFTPLTFEVDKISVEIQVAQKKLGTIDYAERIRVDPYTAIPPVRYGGFSGMYDPKIYLTLDVDTGRAASLRRHLETNQDSHREVELTVFLRGTSQLGRFDSPPAELRIPMAAAGFEDLLRSIERKRVAEQVGSR